MIPFLDVKAGYLELRAAIDEAIARVMQSGLYVLGDEVEAFEREFAAWTGANYCIGVANGLDALTLALRAVGVKADDEVIVPAHTFIATWLAVTQVGAVPVPVDVRPDSYCLDPQKTEDAITPRTKAILPVDLYGHAAEISYFRDICRRRGLRLIEDAAQAHGTTLDGIRVGAHADVTTWSFYPGKNLGAYGDGGAVTTDDPSLARHIAILRNYGAERKYAHESLGVNSRLDPLQAAILRAKLPVLDEWNQRRARIATLYTAGLAATGLGLPQVAAAVDHAWHLYTVTHTRRDELRRSLAKAGIETLIHYPTPPFRQRAYASYADQAGRWPIADRIAQQTFSLPIGPHLKQEDAQSVISEIGNAMASLRHDRVA